ncbi:MAG: metallophosphoesterase [Acidobacteriota bacterium]
MRLLLFSDLHRDIAATELLLERSANVDVLVGAGDFAVVRQGINDVLRVLRTVEKPCIFVPGNGESFDELEAACAGWSGAHVLHGSGVELDGVSFFGLGGGVPVTPFGDWSWDLSEDEAADLLERCPESAVLVSHSPPFGTADTARGQHLGSTAVRDTLRSKSPKLLVCGHIHDSWETDVTVETTRVINAGPRGIEVEI